MSTNHLIEQILKSLQSDDVYNSLDFAKFVGTVNEFEITVPITDFEPLYREAEKLIEDNRFVRSDLEAFIRRGCDHIASMHERSKTSAEPFEFMRLTAHSASRIVEFTKALELTNEVPDYLPETYSVENPYGTPRYAVYWKWATVQLSYIHRSLLPLLQKTITEFEQSRKENRVASLNAVRAQIATDNIKSVAAQKAAKQQVIQQAQIAETPELETKADIVSGELRDELEFQQLLQKENSDAVQFSMFVARRYLNKIQDASHRGIVFTLTIEDFTSLLRNRVCHFTGVPLTVDIGSTGLRDRKIPDNYLSIDRMDANKGYTRENVVVCAHSVNVAKNRMTEQEFRQITGVASLMQSLSPEQRIALNSLMSTGT